jgi:Uma2 family endonuclease
MTTATNPPASISALSAYSLRQFTVDEYHRMIEADILNEEDAVELLEGWIVLKMTHKPSHDVCIELTGDALRGCLPPGWRLRIQSSITTADSEPGPDIAVVRGDPRSRAARHPGPPDLGLVIEVADSSLTRDRTDKGRLYARAGIVCYWIVNLADRQVEVYSDPAGPPDIPAFRRRQVFLESDSVPLTLDGQEVARLPVLDLLP